MTSVPTVEVSMTSITESNVSKITPGSTLCYAKTENKSEATVSTSSTFVLN